MEKNPAIQTEKAQNNFSRQFNNFIEKLKQIPPWKWLLFTSLFILLGLLIYYFIAFGLQEKKISDILRQFSYEETGQTVASTPKPTPKPLPTGRQTYNISHSSQVLGPKPTQAIIDPIDPNTGQTQTLIVTIPHDKPLTEVKAFLYTDHTQKQLALKNTQSGIWVAQWTMEDTYLYKYQIQFIFSDANETFKGALTFR